MSTSRSRKGSRSKQSGPTKLYSELARKIVSESLHLKQGDSVTVETWNSGLEFAKQVVKEAKRVGAIPIMILEDDDAYLWGLQNSPKDSLGKMGKHEYNLLSATDAYVFIPGPLIGTYNPSVNKEDGSVATAYNSSWYEAAEKAGIRGVRLSFGYVGKDLAGLLGKKPEEIITRQMKAALVDQGELLNLGKPIMSRLVDDSEAVLQSGGESLVFSLKGDLGIEDGVTDEADVASKNNISYILPGFVWKDIVPESASGKVAVAEAVTRLGLVEGATLEFDQGKLISWKGKDKRTQQKLDQVLGGISEEKRLLTTLTIGLNQLLPYGYAQDRFVAGSIGLSGFGITGIVKTGTLSVAGQALVEKGKLSSISN